ncbi:5'-nucleotidase (5'-NT) (Ecto-5'-nucleotidase) (CD antigen CD73) [Durusdinium trenchii]|uniref:5'-nucleotidase (5'-NT) (Ecto-5'-nucleotidase) (CD antigen CD73) n=1 Tax=Durusdinium trenchii TaxID=1381693 RepID=A0ABP0JE62_9DINO
MACFQGCWPFLRPFDNSVESRSPSLRILTANDIYRRWADRDLNAFRCSGAFVKAVRGSGVRRSEFTVVERRLRKAPRLSLTKNGGASKFVLPGDLLGGSLFANLHQGESVIDLLTRGARRLGKRVAGMNAIHVDYCVLGNHEFDFGAERTKELMNKSSFPWLGSNVRDARPPSNGHKPLFHTTLDYDVFPISVGAENRTVLVGVFGLCTAATPQLSQPGSAPGGSKQSNHVATGRWRLAAAGHDMARRHAVCIDQALTVEVNDKELAESCPGINVILGGHDHDPFFLVHRGVLIAKCGQNADHLGVLDLHLAFTGPNHSLQAEHSFQFLNTSSASADPEVAKIVEKWNAQDGEDETATRRALGSAPRSSRTNELRTRENSFGGLVADAMRWTFRHQGCQGAIINGGFVRHDRIYLPGPLTPGALGTRSQINEEMPFNKRIALQRLSGQQLRRGLEEMLRSTPTPVACFPQISEGMHLVYSPEAPAMEKIKSLKINGSEVDPQREVTRMGLLRIAVSEFYTLVAADGVTTFHDTPVLELYEGLIREAVAARTFGRLRTTSSWRAGRFLRSDGGAEWGGWAWVAQRTGWWCSSLAETLLAGEKRSSQFLGQQVSYLHEKKAWIMGPDNRAEWRFAWAHRGGRRIVQCFGPTHRATVVGDGAFWPVVPVVMAQTAEELKNEKPDGDQARSGEARRRAPPSVG